jgi:proteic killer suppression protein
VIQSFKHQSAAELFAGRVPVGLPTNILSAARRKLLLLAAADTLLDLRSPPGNQLHVLKGNRAGQHAIRINDQWRLCFVWNDAGVTDVEITDYH